MHFRRACLAFGGEGWQFGEPHELYCCLICGDAVIILKVFLCCVIRERFQANITGLAAGGGNFRN